jgi:hypothetical protein
MCRKRRMRERTRCEAGFLSEMAMGIGTPADSCLSSDIRLPEASGWVVARAYRERFRNQPVLYAELNAELERQTSRDTTRGPARRLGQRGAAVADTEIGLTHTRPDFIKKPI